MSKGEQMKIRLPADLKAFVADQADRYGNTLNSEIVRAVRERMERTTPATGNSYQASPAAGHHDSACQGAPATHG